MTELAAEMAGVIGRVVDPETAVKLVRAVLRVFGGQLVRLPKDPDHDRGGASARVYSILEEEIGGTAWEVLKQLCQTYGGMQLYLPLSRRAFRDEDADAIYRRYDGKTETMQQLCQEYDRSYVEIYRLYHHGRERSKKAVLQYQFFGDENKTS